MEHLGPNEPLYEEFVYKIPHNLAHQCIGTTHLISAALLHDLPVKRIEETPLDDFYKRYEEFVSNSMHDEIKLISDPTYVLWIDQTLESMGKRSPAQEKTSAYVYYGMNRVSMVSWSVDEDSQDWWDLFITEKSLSVKIFGI